MKSIAIVSLLMILLSCASTSSNDGKNEKDNWCEYIAYGTFEGKTNDGVKVHVKCEQINEHPYYVESDGFHISFELPNGKKVFAEGGTKLIGFFELREDLKDISFNKPISLQPDALALDNERIYNSDFELGELRLTYISGDKLKLEFPKGKEAVEKLSSSKVSEEIESLKLTKTRGLNECFDPLKSYKSFTKHEKNFIGDLDIRGWAIANEEMYKNYFLDFDYTGILNFDDLKGFGSIYTLDLNDDGEEDICGYFSHQYKKDKKLVFKIFLNNGVSYDNVYSLNIDKRSEIGYSGDVSYLGGVYYPDTINGKEVLYGGGDGFKGSGFHYIFFNKLKDKIDKRMLGT